jgi:hypothetical protein
LRKGFKILGLGIIALIILYLIWLKLPFTINRHLDIKLGNKIIDQIETYRKTNGLPESNDWETLKKFGFIDHLDFLEPEYQKLNDNEYQLLFVKGFDGPYLLWTSIEKKWKIDQPQFPDNWMENKLNNKEIIESKKIWSVEFDTISSKFYMKETNSLKSQTLNQVIEKLNEENPQIILKLNRISNDTVFVQIDDSEFLTEQCGTAGADSYLASVIYNLTEFKNIEYVNFDFELGDHANPGTYSRTNYTRF